MKSFLLLAILSTVICVSVSASAGTWYVDGSVSSSGDGTSWGTAFKKIQEGIDASSDSDTAIVAKGTYVENICFYGKNIVVTSTDPLAPAVVAGTIIDGNQSGPVVTFFGTETEPCILSGFTIRNGESPRSGGGICGGPWDVRTHATIQNNAIRANSAALSGGGLAVCDGTIQNNTITGNSAPDGGGLCACGGTIQNNAIAGNWAYYGGGLASCNGTIRGNTITGNSAAYDGGGLAVCNGTIENNTISDNGATDYGGGLDSCGGMTRGNTITGNSAGFGGGLHACNGLIVGNVIMANLAVNILYHGGGAGAGLDDCDGTIQENTISDNVADFSAGGLLECDGVIRGNTISENVAVMAGGGGLLWCHGIVENNRIVGNQAVSVGGGLAECDGVIRNNLIAGNSATGYDDEYDGVGGGLRSCNGAIESNTIVGNSADIGGGLSNCTAKITNCIIWGNTAPTGGQLYESSLPTYSCIQTPLVLGEGNINLDPRFVDPDGPDDDPATYDDNNYRLSGMRLTSPCIDAGKNEKWMLGAVDLDGNRRVFKGLSSLTVDMGAYEYGSFPFKITGFLKTSVGQVALTWNSRRGDTYMVLSSASLGTTAPWTEEARVPSEGETTSWTGPNATPACKFYRIELE